MDTILGVILCLTSGLPEQRQERHVPPLRLACAWNFAILKASACTNTDKDWQAQRRLSLYHRAMDHVIAEINELCKTERYYRWADKLVHPGKAFWHIISMDWLEIAATALSTTMVCPTANVQGRSWTRQTSCILSGVQQMSVLELRWHVQSRDVSDMPWGGCQQFCVAAVSQKLLPYNIITS